jgi:hypothetical protein
MPRPYLECYRREMVKALLHCPRLLNWIETHDTTQFPCAFNYQPANQCPACAFKSLAATYWTRTSTQAEIDQRVTDLDIALFWPPIPLPLPLPWTASKNGMEDPTQYAEHMIHAFEASNQAGAAQSQSIFSSDLIHTDTCTACGHVSTRSEPNVNIMSVPVLEAGVDNLVNAIDRKFATTMEKNCATCSARASILHDITTNIRAGPQILIVQLLLYRTVPTLDRNGNHRRDEKGNLMYHNIKIGTKVNFPKILNLSRHQTDRSVPLRYNLKAVTSHSGGSVNDGHYMGQMKPPTGSFKTNDLRVAASTPAEFTEWPQLWYPPPVANNNAGGKKKGKVEEKGYAVYAVCIDVCDGLWKLRRSAGSYTTGIEGIHAHSRMCRLPGLINDIALRKYTDPASFQVFIQHAVMEVVTDTRSKSG